MKQIILSGGKFATVDDEDYVWLNKWKWSTMGGKKGMGKNHKTWYAHRSQRINGKDVMFLMHRVILNAHNCKVDHKDGNGLNNCKHNLRKATHAQNMQNKKGSANSRSKYKGVSYYTYNGNNKIRATIKFDKKQRFLGYFKKETEAAVAYDRAALKYFGDFAWTNFEYLDKKGIKFKLKRKDD